MQRGIKNVGQVPSRSFLYAQLRKRVNYVRVDYHTDQAGLIFKRQLIPPFPMGGKQRRLNVRTAVGGASLPIT